MDKKTGKKRKWNIGTAQPAYHQLQQGNRSDLKEKQPAKKRSRLQRKRLLKNGRAWH